MQMSTATKVGKTEVPDAAPKQAPAKRAVSASLDLGTGTPPPLSLRNVRVIVVRPIRMQAKAAVWCGEYMGVLKMDGVLSQRHHSISA